MRLHRPRRWLRLSPSRSGEALFFGICASCHGLSGEGQPNWHIRKEDGTLPPPPLNGDGHTWHHGDGFLYKVVRDGGKWMESPDIPHFKSGMPAFGEQLSHDEISRRDHLRQESVGRQDGPGDVDSGVAGGGQFEGSVAGGAVKSVRILVRLELDTR